MPISFEKFVSIVSGVGGGVGVRQRDLILRIFTESQLVPTDNPLTFTSAADVTAWFGSASEESARAALYFAYVNPSTSRPRAIQFARYAPAATAPTVIGNNDAKVITPWAAVAAGVFSITLAGVTSNVGPLNLAASANLTAVATALQVGIRAVGGAYATATVTYGGSLGAQRFVVTAVGQTGSISIQSTATGANDVATLAGLTTATRAVNSSGIAMQTPRGAVVAAQYASNNYGTFLFQTALQIADVITVASGNAAENVKFMYSQRVTAANASAWSAALIGYAGVALTLDKTGEYQDLIMPAITAATNYNQRAAVVNYMYRQMGGMSATVNDDAFYEAYNALRVNFYGNTSSAGQSNISFYQRGKLMGTGTDPIDINVYANEMWLKDYCATQLLSAQLSLGRIPANDSGRAIVLNTVQGPVDAALRNGVISVGKSLTSQQRAYIIEQTGDPNAWQVVQNVGYVLSCEITSSTATDGSTEYTAAYRLIYSKDDAVRKIEGTHSLI